MTIDKAKDKLKETFEHLQAEIKKLRTGRASASILDNITVEVYGQMMPLKHIASIKVVDAQMLAVAPFDPHNLDAISAAIREDKALGLNPADDGKVIRLPMPPMTTERREEVVKQLKEKLETAHISMRNIRHEVLNQAKQQKTDGDIGEDDYKRTEKDIKELMDQYGSDMEEAVNTKEEEILKV